MSNRGHELSREGCEGRAGNNKQKQCGKTSAGVSHAAAGQAHRVRIRGHVRGESAFCVTESGAETAEGKAGR